MNLSPKSIPGEPKGMPGTVKPIAFGWSSDKNFSIYLLGICPSKTKPLEDTVVWQDLYSGLIP